MKRLVVLSSIFALFVLSSCSSSDSKDDATTEVNCTDVSFTPTTIKYETTTSGTASILDITLSSGAYSCTGTSCDGGLDSGTIETADRTSLNSYFASGNVQTCSGTSSTSTTDKLTLSNGSNSQVANNPSNENLKFKGSGQTFTALKAILAKYNGDSN